MSLLYAATLLFMPAKFMEMRSITTDAIGVVMIKIIGANAFGWALLSWFGRSLTGENLRPIFIAMIGGWGLTGALITRAMMTLHMSAMGWADVGVAVVFTLIYGYLLLAKKG